MVDPQHLIPGYALLATVLLPRPVSCLFFSSEAFALRPRKRLLRGLAVLSLY